MTTEMKETAPMKGPDDSVGPTLGGMSRPIRGRGKSRAGVILDRPGLLEGSWERWFFPSEGGQAEQLDHDSSVQSGRQTVTAIPSSMLYSWPLWISAEGEPVHLARMELSGRHFLKRGMEASLAVIPVLETGARRLVMAVATEEPFPDECMLQGWKASSLFQLPCNVLGDVLGHDLVLWQEWGGLQMAFLREGKPVWFCGLDIQGAGNIIHRSALRLLSEKVIDHLPLSMGLCGIPPGTAEICSGQLQRIFPRASIRCVTGTDKEGNSTLPRPVPPAFSVDIPPTEAVAERHRRDRLRRILNFGAAAVVLYFLLILWGAGDLLIRRMKLNGLNREAVSLSEPALRAKASSDKWNASRPAVDPSTYPLDLLAAAAVPTEGGKVRLTGFSMDQDHLQISGEATDVTQAYAFIEQLKNNALLQEYEWTAGQPQLAGKNSVRFEMNGTRNPPKP